MSDWAVVALLSAVSMVLAWCWQRAKANAGIVDVVWAYGMMCAGLWYSFTGSAPLSLRISLGLLTGFWFVRLGIHLAFRVFNESEDGRYKALRNAMGQHSQIGFILFFLLQAGFICFLSLPFYAVAQNTQPNNTLVFVALLLAGFAFWGEAVADKQLANFKRLSENRGKSCRDGWWRYSRHPNYFFEWLHWFAYPLMGWGGPYQVVLWLAPVVLFLFLYFFTGIPFSEQQALRSRGEDYRNYQQATSAFFPWYSKS